jgi:hypothetical protein
MLTIFFIAERKALPEYSYLKQLLKKKFPDIYTIPPRNDSDAEHADAILASAAGKHANSVAILGFLFFALRKEHLSDGSDIIPKQMI